MVYRGYDEIDQHDEDIFNAIVERVAPGDELWVLGDISRGNSAGTKHALNMLMELKWFSKMHMKSPIQLHLIPGNHERCHPKNHDSHKHQKLALTVFDSVQPFARHKIDGQDVMLSHFPYTRDRHETRYKQYRLFDEGLPLIHGHLHTEDRLVDREIQVSWEAWHRPVEQSEISSLIQEMDLPDVE
ncbi:metallophosphatase [Rhodococcus sp. ACS1]|nr:metallophosphatase [Rhodococcus sp. ACS1]